MKYRLISLTTAKILVLFAAIFISSSIAVFSRFNNRSDEDRHYHGFTYFEGKWWPPNLGSEEVSYSNHGVSRVYKSEIVYILYGNLSHILTQTLNIQSSCLIYRFFNVALFFVTLTAILFSKVGEINVPSIGFVFVCIPRVYRIYSYANSDAWAISLSIFIFLLAVRYYSTPLFKWKSKAILLLGALTGLIFVSKENFLISLILPYSLIAYGTLKLADTKYEKITHKCIKTLILLAVPALLIASPLKIFYPLSQGDYKKLKREMKEKYAAEGFKPSNPYEASIKLKQKGYTYIKLLKEHPWIEKTAKSFWGYRHGERPEWIYIVIFPIGLLLLVLTLLEFKTASPTFRFCLLISLMIIGINTMASLHYSLHIDYEPEGRYLFPSLIPISLWITGKPDIHSKPQKILRVILFAIVYLLCIYSLWLFFWHKLL